MDIYYKLKEELSPCNLSTDTTEIRVRCPYCGDSKKNLYHAHFYIKYQEPHLYSCRRCYTSGMFTNDTLHDMRIYDGDLGVYLTKSRDKSMKMFSDIAGYVTKKRKDFKFSKIQTEVSIRNLAYVNGRLGTNITHEEAITEYKMILDPGRFIINNYIYPNFKDSDARTQNYITCLFNFVSQFAIGFVSYDNSYMIFRRNSDVLLNNDTRRWYFQSVFANDPLNLHKKYYIAKTNIDVMSKHTTKIHLAEGPFDIIKVKTLIDNDNSIFIAVNGKDYVSNILNIVRMGFLDIEINIYSDEEVGVEKYEHIRNHFPINIPINIIYNEIDEDFGVQNVQFKRFSI